MPPLFELLTNPKGFFVALKASAGSSLGTPALMLGLVILVPNVALTVMNVQPQAFLLTSIAIYLIFFAALIGFTALLSGGAGVLRSLEVAAYSSVPFLIAVALLSALSVFGAFGVTIGQTLALVGLLMGWYRLFVGLEVMSGSRAAALRGALLAPVAAFVTVGFSGLLLRWLGLA
jgi:hypothetical protein